MAVLNGQLQGLLHSLEHLQRQGSLPCPPTSTTASGQTIVDVFPQGFWESKLSLLGAGDASVKLYCQPGKPVTQGHFYREPHAGKVAVVLGAGGWVAGLRAGQGKARQGRAGCMTMHMCLCACVCFPQVLQTGEQFLLTQPPTYVTCCAGPPCCPLLLPSHRQPAPPGCLRRAAYGFHGGLRGTAEVPSAHAAGGALH